MIVRNVVMSGEPRALKSQVRIAGGVAEAVRTPAREPAARVAVADSPRGASDGSTAGEAPTEAQLAAARAAAARELAQDLEAVRERARLEGFAAGRTAGLEAGRSEAMCAQAERTQSALAALSALPERMEAAIAHESAQLADACADIVAEAFAKMAGRRLVTRKAALGVVLEVIRRVKDERELTIRVNPGDLPFLLESEPQLRAAIGSRRWRLEPDARVSTGGCLVESSLGTLDGRLEVQLHELGETLRAAKAKSWEAHGPA
jgi:flagellar assembly protein FliH